MNRYPITLEGPEPKHYLRRIRDILAGVGLATMIVAIGYLWA